MRSLHPQRQRLCQMGRSGTAENLLRLNAAQCQAGGETDFYNDPHTKQYPGAASILKGWCGNLKRTDKAIHTYFTHDSYGRPLHMQWVDNYNDLRERFLPNIEGFREFAKIEPEQVLTITVDRGIYGMDVFEEVLAIQLIVENLLADINQQKLLLPDSSGKVLQFFLGQKRAYNLRTNLPLRPSFSEFSNAVLDAVVARRRERPEEEREKERGKLTVFRNLYAF